MQRKSFKYSSGTSKRKQPDMWSRRKRRNMITPDLCEYIVTDGVTYPTYFHTSTCVLYFLILEDSSGLERSDITGKYCYFTQTWR